MQPWSQVLVILLGDLACTGGRRTRQEFVLQPHHAEQYMELEQDLFAQQIFIILFTHNMIIHFSKVRFSCWSLVMYLHCLHGV